MPRILLGLCVGAVALVTAPLWLAATLVYVLGAAAWAAGDALVTRFGGA